MQYRGRLVSKTYSGVRADTTTPVSTGVFSLLYYNANIMHYFDGISTPVGRLHIVVSDEAVLRVYFPGEEWTERFIRKPKHPLIVAAKKQLSEYFQGTRKIFDLPLAPEGTPFQLSVWNVLRKIPYSKTISYSEEARRAGSAKAVRAVGSANGKNPLPIFIPCHRVISTNGTLGGYSGGLYNKQFLLTLESSLS